MADADPDDSSRRPWLIAVVLMLGVLIIGLLLWLVPFGTAIISSANRNNQSDLRIAASGLEHWSSAIPDVARGAFIRGRVEAIAADERDYRDGWRLRASQFHPNLGSYRIVYSVVTSGECAALRSGTSAREGRLPFVASYVTGSGSWLKVVDSFALDDVRALDTAGAGNGDVSGYVGNIGNVAGTARATAVPAGPGPFVVCYAVVIPLEKLLVLRESATRFSNFLVVDAQRRIVAQIGAQPLPVGSLDGLVPQSSALVSTLAASFGGKATTVPQPQRFGDSLEPVDLRIQGRSYLAYVRPFFPPRSFEACQPPADAKPAADAKAGGAAPSADASAAPAIAAAPPPAQCFVVGLMPKSLVFRQIASPPLAILVAIGLALGIAIALLPSLRLILMGPADGIGRIELICVVLGIPAAASLATLAMVFAADLAMHRSAALQDATRIAGDAATTASGEFGAFVAQASVFARAAHAQIVARASGQPDPVVTAAQIARCAGDMPPDAAEPGDALAVNPRPLACGQDADFCPTFADGSGLPRVESFTAISDRGQQFPGSRVFACRQFAGGRANVSGRDYFQRLRRQLWSQDDGVLPFGPRTGVEPGDYVVAQVLGIQDGINKSVVAFKIADLHPGTSHPNPIYAVAGGVLPSLAAPVLPAPMAMMVVDTRDDALPVVIHPQPNHSGGERLQAADDSGGELRIQLRAAVRAATERQAAVAKCAQAKATGMPPPRDCAAAANASVKPISFRRSYDGSEQMFVAAPIAGTSFVVIVHYPVDAIDAQPALTASLALRSWAAFSLLCGGAWLVWLLATGDRGWPRLWPQQRHLSRYRSLTRMFGAIAAVGTAIALALAGAGGFGAIALLVGLLVRLAAAVLLHGWRIHGNDDDAARFLAPVTQRAYSRMLVTLVLCLSVAPMAGFWIDAHDYSTAQARRAALDTIVGPGGAAERSESALAGIRSAFGIKLPDVDGPADHFPAARAGQFGVRFVAAPPRDAAPLAVARTLSTWSNPANTLSPPRDCRSGANTGVVICAADAIDVPGAWRWAARPSMLVGIALVLLGAGLVTLLVYVGVRVLRALTGFGIAVDAVDLPELCLTDLWGEPVPPGYATLNRKSLLVNAPFVMLEMLRRGGTPPGSAWGRVIVVNVAEAGAKPLQLRSDSIVLVTGIDLVIADTDRRKAALALIERMIAYIETLPRDTRARLVILSTTAPLERILDAYERDASRSTADTTRENLRWARVFEDFAAYYFRPIEVTDGKPVKWTVGMARPASPDARAAIDAVLREMRWVPPHVVNGVIGEEIGVAPAALDAACVPIPSSVYLDLYRTPVIDWALSRRFVGEAAAYSYLRSQMIEYYQRRWSSSTHAERLILHNLAFGRLVNLTTAIAFISLVRRGLVVLDPEPRLMNESFAMFVRQAEKLDTIADWQSELPSGAWVKARLPILLTIGALGLAAVGFAIWSGQQLTALIPLLAAGAPALVATLSRLVRSN